MSDEQDTREIGFTRLPNGLLEILLPILGEAELRVALFVARKTYGWHKEDDDLSLSQFEEGTGLSRPSVVAGINGLVGRGLLIKTPKGNNRPATYRLIIPTSKDSLPVDTSKETQPDETSKEDLPQLVKQVNHTSKATLPQLVKQVYTQKKVKKLSKENERKGNAADAAPVSNGKPAKPKETPEETAYYAACVPVVAKAANLDLSIPTVWGQCKKPLQNLYHASIRPTPELLEREFVRRDGYWWTQFWKGKRDGQYPEPHELPGHWQRAMTWRTSPVPVNGNGGGFGRRPAATDDDALSAYTPRMNSDVMPANTFDGKWRTAND